MKKRAPKGYLPCFGSEEAPRPIQKTFLKDVDYFMKSGTMACTYAGAIELDHHEPLYLFERLGLIVAVLRYKSLVRHFGEDNIEDHINYVYRIEITECGLCSLKRRKI